VTSELGGVEGAWERVPVSEPTAIQCHKIHIDHDAVKEVVGGRSAVRVPRAEVRTLRLQRGLVAERPLVQGLLALAMGVGGVWFVLRVVNAGDGPLPMTLTRLGLFAAFCALAAPFVLRGALERGYVLVVETARTTRKLGFGRKAAVTDVARFVDEARAAGVEIRVEASLLR
jgi:hypothetical protein